MRGSSLGKRTSQPTQSQNHSVGRNSCREAFFHSISCLHTEMCQSKTAVKSAMRAKR
ncbi:hypothetical protein SVAN01_05097 [Stagonosporopsis vannaccii]|nr:hypothetical protein SVAN01_05097 [Stagonosporopsis vannaccii]